MYNIYRYICIIYMYNIYMYNIYMYNIYMCIIYIYMYNIYIYVCGFPIDDLVFGKTLRSIAHSCGPHGQCRQTNHHPSQDHHHATTSAYIPFVIILLAESLSLIHYNILQSRMLIVLENPEINQNYSYHQHICHDIFLCTLKDTKYKLSTTETPNRRISTPPPSLVPQVFPSLDTSRHMFSCTCTHTSCYAAVRSHALAHIRHAALRYVLMHLHTYVMLRCCTFSCTCTHTSCYAAVRSHALAHIRHATLLYVLMHLHTYVMLRCCTFSCTCTRTSCYAAVRSHALAHIRHATLLYILMHLHTYVMLRCGTFSCTCTGTQFADRNWDQLDSWLPRSITTLQKGKLNPALYVVLEIYTPVARHGCRQSFA